MKMFLALLLCALPAALAAQSSPKTFTSADHAFKFHYPSLVLCTPKNHAQSNQASWTPADSCAAYTPVCDDPTASASQTLACVAYPKAKFADYPAFNAAAFSVAQINVKTQQECLAAPPGSIPSQKTGNTRSINGTQFHVFHTSDAGMSHYLDSRIYRAFHRTTCYQLSVSIATTNPAVFSQPIKQFTQQDRAKVMRQLEATRDSFQFLN